MHDARMRAVIERHEENITSQYDEDDPNKDQVDKNIKKITLQEEISRIPLNPFPYNKADCPDVNIQNEMGIEAGKFGWCIVCRSSSNLWCKDTKHPVCS